MATPSLSSAVTLRPHQLTGAQSALESLAAYRAVLVVMATGLGKTRLAKAIVRSYFEQGKRCLWLVDTDTLVWQARDALVEDPGSLPVDVDKAKRKAEPWSPIIVASKQTLQNPKRLRRYDPRAFDLIVADEAHHSMSPGWETIFSYFPDTKILGLTATPDRSDCKSLMSFYEDVAFELEIREAIDAGWLVPLRQKFIHVHGLDYSQVRREAMRLREGDMEAALLSAEMIEQMAIPTVELVGNRQTFVFTCSVDHAYAFSAYLNKIGVVAETIEGDQTRLPLKRKQELLEAYKRGDIQMLTNCAALTTGVDAPSTSAITFARPMISRSLYAQCCGRGTRPLNQDVLNDLMYEPSHLRREAIASSVKPDCLLLDFMGNSGRLKLVRSASVMDPRLDQETINLAEKISEDRQLDMNAALSCAEEMRAELLRKMDQRSKDAKHRYEVRDVDPFDGSKCQKIFDLLGLQRVSDRWNLPPTQPQIDALRRWSVNDAELLTRRQASDLIGELCRRKTEGLADIEHLEKLVDVGMLPVEKVRALPKLRARKGYNILKSNGWKRPESWGPIKHDRHPS